MKLGIRRRTPQEIVFILIGLNFWICTLFSKMQGVLERTPRFVKQIN